jgi:hypothetical protein
MYCDPRTPIINAQDKKSEEWVLKLDKYMKKEKKF